MSLASSPTHPPPVRPLAGGRLAAAAGRSSPSCWRPRRPPRATRDPLAPRPPHFAGQGQAGHLPVHDRRRLAPRHVRPQAASSPPTTASSTRAEDAAARRSSSSRPAGKCGTLVSDLFPHVAECVDDLCVIRSMHRQPLEHFQATLGIHTGSLTRRAAEPRLVGQLRPGHENQNLPSFVVLAPHLPYAGTQVWSSDFLPACHQGTRVLPGDGADPRPAAAARRSDAVQELELDLLDALQPPAPAGARPSDPLLAGADPVVRDRLRHAARDARGVRPVEGDRRDARRSTAWSAASTDGFAWQCLVARRLAERGVRFVELIDTGLVEQLGRARRHEGPRAAGEERRPGRSPGCSRT